jgi:hypothetical protein
VPLIQGSVVIVMPAGPMMWIRQAQARLGPQRKTGDRQISY